jgi:hypothetical protein
MDFEFRLEDKETFKPVVIVPQKTGKAIINPKATDQEIRDALCMAAEALAKSMTK